MDFRSQRWISRVEGSKLQVTFENHKCLVQNYKLRSKITSSLLKLQVPRWKLQVLAKSQRLVKVRRLLRPSGRTCEAAQVARGSGKLPGVRRDVLDPGRVARTAVIVVTNDQDWQEHRTISEHGVVHSAVWQRKLDIENWKLSSSVELQAPCQNYKLPDKITSSSLELQVPCWVLQVLR